MLFLSEIFYFTAFNHKELKYMHACFKLQKKYSLCHLLWVFKLDKELSVLIPVHAKLTVSMHTIATANHFVTLTNNVTDNT